jgi:hypothetical protein
VENKMKSKTRAEVLAKVAALMFQATSLNEEARSLLDSIGLTPSGRPKKPAKKAA